jgi:glucokinase
MAVRVGIDIGGTKTKILMISREGEVLARAKIMTESAHDPAPIVARAGEAVHELLRAHHVKPSQVEAVAVGIAGFSNPKTGYIDLSPNLHWCKVPFKAMMEERLGRTVYMANDVNAAAWGEYIYGAGRGCDDLVAVLVGSGIGGGIVSNSRLVEGATGTGAEVGHMTFRVGGRRCDCGKRGCFEAYGGGMPMEHRMRRLVEQGKSPRTLKLAGGEIKKINTKVIRLAAEAGDAVAGKVWAEAEQSLVTLGANLVSLLNPDRLVLGGGVLAGNPGLLATVAAGVRERAVSLSAEHVEVVRSQLGEDAVAMGAAALVDLYR